MMDIKEKASALTESAKSRWTEDRSDRMSRDIERLKAENKVLKDEVDRDRGRLSDLLESLGESGRPKTKPHRIRRFVTFTSAVAGAYVIGARAGRERYEQIKGWMRDRGSSIWETSGDDAATTTPVDEVRS
jgi:hypothetical protein